MAQNEVSGSDIIIQMEAPAEKRWTIMAALLGANMAFALFQGLAQQENYVLGRQIGLIIVVTALPFQAVYFMIQAFMLEYSDKMGAHAMVILQRLSVVCQMISYLSVCGLAMIFFTFHWLIGLSFTLSGLAALVMVRLAMTQADRLAKSNAQ